MQDPNADTEWNDALRKHGIIPEKKKEAEITEDEIIKMVEASVKAKSGVKDVEVRFLVVLIYLILNKEEFIQTYECENQTKETFIKKYIFSVLLLLLIPNSLICIIQLRVLSLSMVPIIK